MITKRVTLFLMLLMLTPTLWADVQASLDRDSIYDGDTVTLTIEANGKDMSVEPDLSVLEKDFSVLGKSSSRRLQFINGKRSDQHQWQIELDPLRRGTLTVPAIPVGNSATSPLTLKVSEQPVANGTGADQPVFIRTEVDDRSSSPFVQQQIHYIVRMYYRVPLVEGNFSDLKITDALIERLGEDKQYQTKVNEQRYQVLERHYAIFPEKSGPLTIPATAFTGRVMTASGRRSGSRQRDSMMERFFGGGDPFNPGKRIRVRSEPLTLDIKPRPKEYRARHWLPSTDLILQDSWEQGPPEFRVGEPVTRTITLQAKGLESSHLPDISIPETDNVRVYPEQAVTENRTDGSWVFGTRKQSLAYVPSRAGRVALPEISIDWWDTTQQRQRSTVLSAWEVNVLAAAGSVTEHAVPVPQSEAPAQVTDATDPSVQEAARPGKLWLTVGLLALLAVLLLLYRKRLQLISGITQTTAAKPKTHTRRKLQKACEQNNPQTAARALLDWAAGEWPDQPPRNLGALAHRIDKGADEIHGLDKALYAAGNSPWNGQALWEIFRQGLHDGKTKDTSSPAGSLPALYPRSKFSNSTHQL
ncbi:MAG: BatD family protein [Gammaproteobacteria bacterium]|nr:MAG: BatD family protein [Gammaproteobacteria bacterium]